MDIETVKAALYKWMHRETGITIIFANQGHHRPKRPYGSINFVNAARRVGSIDASEGDGSNFKLSGLRSTLVSLNIFGDGANDKMAKLRDTLDLPNVIEELSSVGIAVVDEEGPKDLTGLLETKYEERSQMDLTLNYAQETEVAVVPIESVEIDLVGTVVKGKVEIKKL